MNHITLYVRSGGKEIVDKARKLSRFYEDKSIGDILIERCKEIIMKYGNKTELLDQKPKE